MADTTALGNAGEHLVMAELLSRGYQAFWADRGNKAFDIAVFSGGKHSLIRVKTTTSTNLQWSAKKDGTIFPQMQQSGDFVAIVVLKKGPIRSAQIYIVPTGVVDCEIRKCYAYWLAHSGTRRARRQESTHRGLGMSGKPTTTNIAYGYAESWIEYLEAWHQLGATVQQ